MPDPAAVPESPASPAAGGVILSNYLVQHTLGQGTFGKVKLAVHMPTGERVAIKILEKARIKEVADAQRVAREIKILKRMLV
jgi:5'-AMP-activated protein kinase, catalytic alpha subunit